MNQHVSAGAPPARLALAIHVPSPKRLLALPLLYKVLFANSIVILMGATLGTFLATRLRGGGREAMLVGFVIAGMLLSVVINFALLKLALYPLTRLRETMDLVQAGNLRIRAPVTGQDADADQLATTFNTMLSAIDELSRTRANQILHAQEEERKRIARELHDETSQILTSLLISLAMLEEKCETDEQRQRIADTRALAHQTLRAVRNLSIDLRPSALDDLGLVPALRAYVKQYQQKCGIATEFTAHGLKERLSPELETAIYRIVQESLTNTAKHAQASRVSVTIEESNDGMVTARVVDDGQGFDAAGVLRQPWQDRGLGLAGMTERAALVNGTVDIVSTPAAGTTITVAIPAVAAQREAVASAADGYQGHDEDTLGEML